MKYNRVELVKYKEVQTMVLGTTNLNKILAPLKIPRAQYAVAVIGHLEEDLWYHLCHDWGGTLAKMIRINRSSWILYTVKPGLYESELSEILDYTNFLPGPGEIRSYL